MLSFVHVRTKTSYALLVKELHKRFTLVHLQAVQSSLFNNHKQKSGESVDIMHRNVFCFIKPILMHNKEPEKQRS